MAGSSTALDFDHLLKFEKQRLRQRKSQEGGGISNKVKKSSNSEKENVQRRANEVISLKTERISHVNKFLSPCETSSLSAKLQSMPDNKWSRLNKRRLITYGGTPHPNGMVPLEIPSFIMDVFQLLVDSGMWPSSSPPNHVLLNEYSGGQGISPHQDGPMYEPRVAILSLGSSAWLDFWESKECTNRGRHAAIESILCEDGSLVIFEGHAYEALWHGIVPEKEISTADRLKRRLSLTIRTVKNVLGKDSTPVTEEQREEEKRKVDFFLRSVNDLN